MKQIIVSLVLFLSLLVSPVVVLAQDGTLNDNPGAITSEDGRGGVFDWWWLLPLLAIPLLFFVLRDRDGDETARYRDRELIGSKGGRTRRHRDEDEEELL